MSACVLGMAFVASLLAGSAGLGGLTDWDLARGRLSAAGIAAVVGAALSVSGVLLQAILRNPLASPFVLGATSGAGLGIAVSAYAGYAMTGSIVSDRPSAAAVGVGAFGAMVLVYGLAQRRGVLDPGTLLLVGVMVAMVAGSATSLVQSMLPDAGLSVQLRWLLGNVTSDTPVARVWAVAVLTGAGVVGSAMMGPSLDSAALGDEEARSLGVDMRVVRISGFAIAGVLTSGAVLIAGPIGFVGLVAPHIARLIAGVHHRALVVNAALLGAAMVLAAYAVHASVRLPAGRIPVGVLTALVGGPVFLVLLIREQRGRGA